MGWENRHDGKLHQAVEEFSVSDLMSGMIHSDVKEIFSKEQMLNFHIQVYSRKRQSLVSHQNI